MRQTRMMASWVLALFLAAMYLWIADLTLFPPDASKNVVFPALVAHSGISLWEPTGRFATGIAHVLAAILVLPPFTRRLGAILAVLVAAGAVTVHVLWLGIELPVAIGSEATDGGQTFYLAIALLVASGLLAFIHPGKASGQPAHGGGMAYYGR